MALSLCLSNGSSRAGTLPGDVDESFRPGWGVAGRHAVSALHRSPDGKVLVAFADRTTGISQVGRLLPDGSPDPDFAGPVEFDNIVRAILLDTDGRILVGGDFGTAGGRSRACLARLSSGGSVDDWMASGLSGNPLTIQSLRYESDGSMVVGGTFDQVGGLPAYGLARLRPDGTADPDFAARAASSLSGMGPFTGQFSSLPDGGILAGDGRLFRLFADGRLDHAFPELQGHGGFLSAYDDRRMLFVSGLPARRGFGREVRVRLTTLLADGSPDPTSAPPLTCRGSVVVVAPTSEGRILLGGELSAVDGDAVSGLVRRLGDGTLDRSFVCPLFDTPVSGETTPAVADIRALAVGPDFVLVGGFFDRAGSLGLPGLARLHLGTLPPGLPTFVDVPTEIEARQGEHVRIRVRYRSGTPATVRWYRDDVERAGGSGGEWDLRNAQPGDSGSWSCAISNASGQVRTPAIRVRVTRAIATPGAVDSRFDANSGSVFVSQGGSPITGVTAAPASDGRWFVQGRFVDADGAPMPPILRLLVDGQQDGTFDLTRHPEFQDGERRVFAMVVDGEGRVLASTAESATGKRSLVRALPDGSKDPSFVPGAAGAKPVRTIQFDRTGGIVLTTGFDSVDPTSPQIHRLLPDGSTDPDFVVDPVELGTVQAALVLDDGRIVVITRGVLDLIGTESRIRRLTRKGRFDTTFAQDASVRLPSGAMVALPDGKLLVGTLATSPGQGLIRLEADGRRDASFVLDSRIGSGVGAVAVAADGRLYVWSGTRNGWLGGKLLELDASGAMNTAFTTPTGLFSRGSVQAIHPADDGTVLVAGDFEDGSDFERPAIVRLFRRDERQMLDPRFAEGRFRASIWTQSGGVYVVEARDVDRGGGWQEVSRLTGDATVRTFTEPASGAVSRIYRVRIQP